MRKMRSKKEKITMAGKSMTRKILEDHLAGGRWGAGKDIAIKIDQVLLQDATGTQACMQLEQLFSSGRTLPDLAPGFTGKESVVLDENLHDGFTPLLQFEQFGADEVKVPLAVQYVDHNVLQIDERNSEDHAFLYTFCQRHGIWVSPLGNGICHYQHVERFAVPGAVILGADSHTTSSGAMGAFALGVGGLDAAAALAGYPLRLKVPKVVAVHLAGKLPPWVGAKNVVLELLRRYKVKWGIDLAGIGGVMVLEFIGPGVKTLNVFERLAIANMSAELNGTAIFPSDAKTLEFMKIQRRENNWQPLAQDPGAAYDLEVEIDLGSLEPLIAMPSNPDNVVRVTEVAGTPVAQVCVGSSANSGYEDMAVLWAVLKGKKLPHVQTKEGRRLLQLLVSPGSRQIWNVMERKGFLRDLAQTGAQILGSICGWCVGMGGAPPRGVLSVRTGPRNFKGRSGTKDDLVALADPHTAAATALVGVITDPRTLGSYPRLGKYDLRESDFTDHFFVKPPATKKEREKIVVVRGSHMQPPPRKGQLAETLSGEVIAKFGDNLSTGSISPDGAIVMGKRSNIADIAKHCFEKEMPAPDSDGPSEFYRIARGVEARGGSFVIGGRNYGQGSSREVAAMTMVELGVHAVLAKSFYRTHRDNLIGQGVLPLVISDELYDAIVADSELAAPYVMPGQTITLPHVRKELLAKKQTITIAFGGRALELPHYLQDEERKILLAGGLINFKANRSR